MSRERTFDNSTEQLLLSIYLREAATLKLNVSKYDIKNIEKAVDAALEAGYRHIDTAYVYDNEAEIGQALVKWLESGKIKREELFITTKLPHYALRPECVEKYLKMSLANLQLDYVDLFLVHHSVGCMEISKEMTDPFVLDPETDHVKIWKAMEAQVDAGRAKSIGLSNFNARQVKRVWQSARIKPVMLQIELHVFFEQREIVTFCKALDMEVTAYAPLGCPDIGSVARRIGRARHLPALKMTYPLEDPLVKKIAKKHNRTPAQVLLRHTIQRGIIVIPKSSDPTRIRDNFNVFDFELSQEEDDELRTLDKFNEGRLFDIAIFPGKTGNPEGSHPEWPFKEPY